jgi:hypothetical protein
MRLTTRLLLVLASCFALGAVAVPSHAALLGAKKALKNAASVKVHGQGLGDRRREPQGNRDEVRDAAALASPPAF